MAQRGLILILVLGTVATAPAGATSLRQDVDGTLDAGSLAWHRPMSGGTGGTYLGCNADLSGESAAEHYYDAYAFVVETTDPIGISVVADRSELDLMLFLYCEFDPTAPLAGAILADDEDGPAFPWNPAVLPADGVSLVPGTVYHLVITTFVPGATGSYTVTTTTDNVVPSTTRTWGALRASYR